MPECASKVGKVNYIVLSDSTGVILPLRTRLVAPAARPILKGVLISQARTSGRVRQLFVELQREGIPRPFRGADWCYEWRVDGDEVLACWVGFPDVFFTASFEPDSRIAVEAIGFSGSDSGRQRMLSHIDITLKPSEELIRPIGEAGWRPESIPRPLPSSD